MQKFKFTTITTGNFGQNLTFWSTVWNGGNVASQMIGLSF